MNFSGNDVTIRAFFINLDSRTDRLKNLEVQASKIPFRLERVSAKTPTDLDPSKSRFVSEGVAACWESHLMLFNRIVDENIDIALICEDDFDFQSFDLTKCVDFMIASDMDVLQLGFLNGTIGRKIDLCGRNILHLLLHALKRIYMWFPILYRIREFHLLNELRFKELRYVPYDFRFGTHCYLISFKAAKEVRNLNNPQFLAADDFFVALSKMKHFQIARLFFSKAAQMKSPSSIK